MVSATALSKASRPPPPHRCRLPETPVGAVSARSQPQGVAFLPVLILLRSWKNHECLVALTTIVHATRDRNPAGSVHSRILETTFDRLSHSRGSTYRGALRPSRLLWLLGRTLRLPAAGSALERLGLDRRSPAGSLVCFVPRRNPAKRRIVLTALAPPLDPVSASAWSGQIHLAQGAVRRHRRGGRRGAHERAAVVRGSHPLMVQPAICCWMSRPPALISLISTPCWGWPGAFPVKGSGCWRYCTISIWPLLTPTGSPC